MAAPYSWLPKKAVEKDYEHPAAILQRTGLRRNHFHVNPDWVSEENHPRTPLGLRRYRPWPFEFQGARFYPWGSREKRWADEAAARDALEADDNPAEQDPVTEEEREVEFPRVTIYTQDTRAPWDRPQTNSNNGNATYSRHLRLSAPAPPQPVYPSIQNRYSADPQSSLSARTRQQAAYFSGRAPYEPLTYRGPAATDEELRERSMMISKFTDSLPHSGRPRFERPYLNFANSQWMRYAPDIAY